MKIDLNGNWELTTEKFGQKTVIIPGTLDENKVGDPDVVAKPWHPDVEDRNKKLSKTMEESKVITSRLTRNYTYEGPVHFGKIFDCEVNDDKRYFLVVERSRALSLKVDGKSIDPLSGSLSTPYRFEVTGLLHKGSRLELICDNTYPGLPYQDIVFSSAATDESQTNWNGLIGDICIEEKEKIFIGDVRIYPFGNEASIEVDLYLDESIFSNSNGICNDLDIVVSGDCLEQEVVFEKINKAILDGDMSVSGKFLDCDGEESISRKGIKCDSDEVTPITIKLPKVLLSGLAMSQKWDEFEGNLQNVEITLQSDISSNDESETFYNELDTSIIKPGDRSICKRVIDSFFARFGIRSFSYDEEGRLTLNGRRFFLRSEANCAYFPETGHPPMDEDSWETIIKTYMSYGVNCLRFHSWCPPEAAFSMADKLGILMQPELSHWNPRQAFETSESRFYYEKELREILKAYANHPSFVMLSLGNELQSDDSGIEEMHRLLNIAKNIDPTRLYAWGSNNFYGAKGTDADSDFFTSARFKDRHIRESGNKGFFNTRYPASKFDFEFVMEDLRKEYDRPVFGFEVGQYEILPDFDQLEDFKGVTRADNIAVVRDRVKELGISDDEWKKRVNATGEIALLSYREEVEAVMRTKSMSGLSLLGLQDFPGQGTALVGMLDSHLKAKPFDFAKPERFRAFFSDKAILALMRGYTYTNNDILKVEVKVANYGKEDICGQISYSLIAEDGDVYAKGIVGSADYKSVTSTSDKCASDDKYASEYNYYASGDLTPAGKISIDLGKVSRNTRFNLILSVASDEALISSYPIWVYFENDSSSCEGCSEDNDEDNNLNDVIPVCPDGIYETRWFDDKAIEVLSRGGKVYLSPSSTKEAMPNSIKAQFSTDFWSVGTFPEQEGAMGQLIDKDHPIFDNFPTEGYTNYQWWSMATQRALILPKYMDTIITEMDCYAYLRPMTQLMEVRCGGGRLLISSMGLQDLMKYPEARALLKGIYSYMDSDKFEPKQEMSVEAVLSLFEKQDN